MKMILKNIRLPLADFCLEVDVEISSQVTVIFGPSGSGKTSLLDTIAGLRRPKSAFIQIGDRVLTDLDAQLNIPPRQRQIGYVPQDLALFPHLSVRENLIFGDRETSAPEKLFSFAHVTEVLEIQHLSGRSVTNLSGGEKQRVALARALLTHPRLLLLDEPLANLDSNLKARIIPYFIRIRDEFRLPMIYVTHDLDEARPLCNEILFMERGRLTTSSRRS